MAKIHYTADIDNRQFNAKLNEMQKGIKGLKQETVSSSAQMVDSLKKIAGAVGVTFGAAQLVNFEKQIVKVRGDMQQLEVAFRTMLGDEEKALKLLNQTVQFAAVTPFDVEGVASGVKQLLAYGSTAEDVIEEMRMLGDIAAGLSIPLNDIVYLFGTTRTQGRLYTQDLRQFMGRGIPLAEELAKQFGVTKDKVGELVTEGKVGFEQVNKALRDMTSEGGKFAGLMEAQSKTIAGQISNLEDAIAQMFNKIGQSQEGAISTVLSGASFLVENYEKVGKVLLATASAWGIYKAAVIACAAANKLASFGESIRLIAMLRKELGLATAAQQAFNIASKANIYVALASAVLAVASSLLIFRKRHSEVAQTVGEAADNIDREKTELKELFAVAEDEAKSIDDRRRAIDTINARYGDYLDHLLTEKDSVSQLKTAYTELTGAIEGKYLAELKDQIVSGKQTEYTTAKGDLMTGISDVLKDSGLRQGQKGSFTAEVQNWLQQYAQYNNSQEIYNALSSIYERYNGNALTNRQKGTLLQQIEAYKQARAEYDQASYQFEQFAAGYKGPQQKSKKADEPTPQAELSDEQKKEITKRQKIARENAKAENEAEKAANQSRISTEIELQQAREQARIDAMEGGEAKYRAQLQLNYEKERTVAEREYSQTVQQEIARQREAYAKLNNDSEEGFVADDNSEVIQQAKAVYQTRLEISRLANQQEMDTYLEQADDAMTEYLSKYGSFEERKLAIAQKYDKQIAEASTEGDKKSLEAQKQVDLNDLERNYNESYKRIFRNAGSLAKTELIKTLTAAQQELNALTARGGEQSAEIIKDIQKQINDVIGELVSRRDVDFTASWGDFGAKVFDIQNLEESREELKKSGESTEEIDESIKKSREDLKAMAKGAALNTFVSGLNLASESMRQIAEATGDEGLGKAAELLGDVGDTFNAVLQGAQSGGLLGAAIAGIQSIATKLVEAFTSAYIAEQRITKEAENYRKQLQLISLEVGDNSTIFGTAQIEKGAEAWKKAKQGLSSLREELENLRNENVNLTNYSWFAKLFGKRDKIMSLSSLAPDIFNSDNTVNVDAAQAFLETHEEISDTLREEIEEAIELQEAINDANDALDEVASNYVGSLAGDLADAVWDGIVLGGEDAWSKWEDISADAISSIGKELLSEMILNEYLNNFQERVRAAFGSENAGESLLDITNEIIQGLPGVFDDMSAMAQQYKEQFEALGYDFSSSSSRTGSSSGAVSASQDSIDKQSGILTSIQGFAYSIDGKMDKLLENGQNQAIYRGQITALITDIKSDTARLHAIESGITNVYSMVESIALRGVKLQG